MTTSSNRQDVKNCLKKIEHIITSYENLIAKFEAIKKPSDTQIEDFSLHRAELKDLFIAKKQLARSLILLLPANEQAIHVEDLNSLQTAYREHANDGMAILAKFQRDQLMPGKHPGAGIELSDRNTNDNLLVRANQTTANTTGKLITALQVVNDTINVGTDTAATLAANRDKINNISKDLDGIDSELTISKRLLVNYMKRLYTDKIIIAFVFLVLLGIVGIIVYASLNPGQSLFNVPSNVIPPVPGGATTTGNSTRLR